MLLANVWPQFDGRVCPLRRFSVLRDDASELGALRRSPPTLFLWLGVIHPSKLRREQRKEGTHLMWTRDPWANVGRWFL